MVVALIVALVSVVSLSISNYMMMKWILTSMQKDSWVTKPIRKKKEDEISEYIHKLEVVDAPDLVSLRSEFDRNMEM